ncbi:MAG: MFS transporter [Hydrogenibacillus sp.]|nr:MFS transporter [Hydrogenibacillus sp.]
MTESAARKQIQMTHRPIVLAAVMLGMFMAAVESTIVSTAMPTIVGDLGGFQWMSWVFSGFMLAQAITTPIFGKLSDLFGRKAVYTVGVALFLSGSLLSGLSPTMGWLIVFRLLQGLGAGSVMPIATTIVGDIYTAEERARIQGWLSSVWGISAVTGPIIGAFIVEHWHWAWIFWINVPVGVLSVALVIAFLHEPEVRAKPAIDFAGALTLFASIAGWMSVLLFSGTFWPWFGGAMWALTALALTATVLFFFVERRAVEPVMPLELWENRLIAVANGATFVTGMIMIALSMFLPSYIQGVLGDGPQVAGLALSAMSVGWPIASFLSGRLLIVFGPRKLAILGSGFLLLGGLLFALIRPAYGPVYAGAASFFIGMGMGFTNTAYIVSIQNSVPWRLRGAATSNNLFMRLFGGTFGGAVLGALLNAVVYRRLLAAGDDPAAARAHMDDLNALLRGTGQGMGLKTDVAGLVQALAGGMQAVFIAVFLLTLTNALVVWFLPATVKLQDRA